MELPASLRHAVDGALEGVALADLKRASEILSRRYRAETRDGRLHICDELAAKAYLAARLPATYLCGGARQSGQRRRKLPRICAAIDA